MLLRQVLNMFKDGYSEYISSISYLDSENSFELLLEFENEYGEYFNATVHLYEDGEATLLAGKTEDADCDDKVYVPTELVNAYNYIAKQWALNSILFK